MSTTLIPPTLQLMPTDDDQVKNQKRLFLSYCLAFATQITDLKDTLKTNGFSGMEQVQDKDEMIQRPLNQQSADDYIKACVHRLAKRVTAPLTQQLNCRDCQEMES